MMDPGEMAAFPRDLLCQPIAMSKVHKHGRQYKFYLYYSKNTQIYLSLYPIYNKVRTKKSRPDYQSLGNSKTCI